MGKSMNQKLSQKKHVDNVINPVLRKLFRKPARPKERKPKTC